MKQSPVLSYSGHVAGMRSRRCPDLLGLGDCTLGSTTCCPILIRPAWPVCLPAFPRPCDRVWGHFSATGHSADLTVRCFSKQGKSTMVFMHNPFTSSNKVGDNTVPSASSNYFCHLRLTIVLIISRENGLMWVGFRQLFKNCFSFSTGP